MHLLCVVLIAATAPVTTFRIPTLLEQFGPINIEQVMAAEKDSLQHRYHITFPPDCQPSIRVGLSESIPPQRRVTIAGTYRPDSSIIAVNESIVEPFSLDHPWLNLLTNFYLPSLTEVLDHELGHAYSDWVGRSTTGKTWPTIDSTTTLANETGLLIQCEGISQTFEYGPPQFRFRAEWWPVAIDSSDLQPNSPGQKVLSYSGGYQLIGSLVARYGMTKTVAYVVTHPLRLDPQHVRVSVTAWYRRARRSLTLPH